MGFLQGCGSKYTHIAGCCEAGSPTSDQDYVCPLKTGFGGGDIRGYDWWKSGSQGGPSLPDPSANHTSSTVLITEAAIDYIQRHSSGPPFFLWLAYSNVHGPHTVDKQFRDAYEGHDTATTTQSFKNWTLRSRSFSNSSATGLRERDSLRCPSGRPK